MHAVIIDKQGYPVFPEPDVFDVTQEQIGADPSLAPGPALSATGEALYQPRWNEEQWVEGNPNAPAKKLEATKTAKLSEAQAAFDATVSALEAGYPEREVKSWDKQEQEARAYKADPNAVTPWLDAAAGGRWPNRTLAEAKTKLADRIIAKADYAAGVHGAATGERQRIEDAVNAVMARTELPADDPQYLTADQARAEIEAIV